MNADPRIEEPSALMFARATIRHGGQMGQRSIRALVEMIDSLTATLAAADKGAIITNANPRDLIDSLTDPDDCSFDHNNSCQAHGYYYLSIGEKCPNQQAKEWVAAYDEVVAERAAAQETR